MTQINHFSLTFSRLLDSAEYLRAGLANPDTSDACGKGTGKSASVTVLPPNLEYPFRYFVTCGV